MNKRHLYRSLIFLAVIAIFSVDLASPLGLADWIGFIIVLLLAYNWFTKKEIVLMSIFCSILVLMGFFFSPRSIVERNMAVTNRALAIIVLGLEAYLLVKRKIAEDHREALLVVLRRAMDNIRTLKGMLPICAWCKKVRNDSGYWEQIESYISEHSETEFTHGICPECYKRVADKES